MGAAFVSVFLLTSLSCLLLLGIILYLILKPEGLADPHGLSRKNTDKSDSIGTKHLPKNA